MNRKRTAIGGLLVLALLGSCGDRTVTSAPVSPVRDDATASTAGSVPTPGDAGTVAPTAGSAAETSLAEVDRILDEVQLELNTADREASIPEGDPTS